MVIALHINPTQEHQREHGLWLARGFQRHGLKAEVTESPTTPADIHIVSGPHYAKNNWLGHPNTILLDRAYWHAEKSGRWQSMDWVSLGWMRADGGRKFDCGSGRIGPEPKDKRTAGGSIFLADYLGPIEPADTVRLHPAQHCYAESLIAALGRHRTAIGYQTTALVTAALEGLEVVCKDSRNIVNEPNWLELLPYADWHWEEIWSGEAWEHLRDTHNL